MRRIALLALFSVLFAAQVVSANDATGPAASKETTAAATPASITPAATADAPPVLKLPVTKSSGSIAGRSALLSLHVGFAGLQAYDVYSTTTAISRGAVEANPLMRSTVRSRVAFIGVKAATTAGSIFAAERLWRNQHRVGAVALMAISNGMMAVVAVHNASVIAQQARR